MFAPGQNQLLANLSLLLFFKDLSIVRFYDFKKNFRGMCFTVQLSKIGFALPFVSNSFAIVSCRFLPVKNFFQLFSEVSFVLAAPRERFANIPPETTDVNNFFHIFAIIFRLFPCPLNIVVFAGHTTQYANELLFSRPG